MPLVTIRVLEGRTVEQKRGLVKDVTEAIAKNVGCPTEAVMINIEDLKPENVSQGGKLFVDGR
jgi:4-oxalocrotonate tautomerase